MYLSLHSIIPSTFIRSNTAWVSIAILSAAVLLAPVSATSFKLANFELSGVVVNNSDSLAVIFDKEKRNELVLRVGDVVAGCVLDYIRRSRVSFYCNDQVQTLTLRSLSVDITATTGQDVWSPPVAISQQDQEQLFDQPANFITAFNLVPHMQDGQLTAFEIKSTPKDTKVSEALDLKQGDLIIAVNGVSAQDANEFSSAFEQIKFTQSVDIELIRDDVRYYKNYLLQR